LRDAVLDAEVHDDTQADHRHLTDQRRSIADRAPPPSRLPSRPIVRQASGPPQPSRAITQICVAFVVRELALVHEDLPAGTKDLIPAVVIDAERRIAGW